MGIELRTEAPYRALQNPGEFDARSSSWVKAPPDVRLRVGALFRDRRYGRVFVYHNGAQSNDAARGFRGMLRVRRSRRLLMRHRLARGSAQGVPSADVELDAA